MNAKTDKVEEFDLSKKINLRPLLSPVTDEHLKTLHLTIQNWQGRRIWFKVSENYLSRHEGPWNNSATQKTQISSNIPQLGYQQMLLSL